MYMYKLRLQRQRACALTRHVVSNVVVVVFQLNGETMLLLEYDIATNTETVYNSDKAVVLTVRYNAAGSVTHRLSHQADKFTRHHDVAESSD